MKSIVSILLGLTLHAFCVAASADEVRVAVAANFAVPMQQLATAFEKQTGDKVLISPGATGKFYTQIKNGAPFDILFSADQDTPRQLALEQLALGNTQNTYAVGRLVLWSLDPYRIKDGVAALNAKDVQHIAIASPTLAPYGKAAEETLRSLQLWETLRAKLVTGESISQAYNFVATGNAELGFVALSQVWENGKIKSGSAWFVPDEMYQPIRQDVILLNYGRKNAAAAQLLKFLQTPAAVEIIRSFGYWTEADSRK